MLQSQATFAMLSDIYYSFLSVPSATTSPTQPNPLLLHNHSFILNRHLKLSKQTAWASKALLFDGLNFYQQNEMACGKYVFTEKKRLCNTYIQRNSQELTIHSYEIHLKCVQGFGSYLTLNTMTTLQTPTGNCCSGKHMSENLA